MGTKPREAGRADRRSPAIDAPPGVTVVRGGADVGPLFATWPFASLRVSGRELRIRWPFGSETVTRRGGGRVEIDERWLGSSIRLVDDRRRGTIRFSAARPSALLAALDAHGWATERRTRSVRT